MAVKTSATAKLQFAASGSTYADIAKVRDVTLNINRDALETTGLNDADRTYAYGIRSTSGSGTLIYDPTDAATVAIMDQIFSTTEALSSLKLVLDTGGSSGTISSEDGVLITAIGASVSVGELVTVPVSFTISGQTTGQF